MILTRSGMGYTAVWDVGGVEVAVDHLRRRSGELHGELVVHAAASPVLDGRLHRASFNLSSSQARERLGKGLEGRSKIDVPWGEYLEEFCAGVLEAERTGAPLIPVGDLDAPEDQGFLVDPLLPERKASILYAAGGTGKSYMAILLSVAVASGVSVLGWPVTQGGVLYLDWETDEYEVDSRIKRVAGGFGMPVPKNILYRACAGSLDDMAERIASVVADKGIRLVIVDSVGMASGVQRDAPAEESAIRLFAAFRYFGCTVLAIDHVSGADARNEQHSAVKPYGSIYKVNLARSVWELKGALNEHESKEGHLALFHRKVNRGMLHPPIGIKVTHDDHTTRFEPETINDEGLVRSLSTSVRVERALRSGPLQLPEIVDVLGISKDTVSVALTRGRDRLFTRLADGRWALAARP